VQDRPGLKARRDPQEKRAQQDPQDLPDPPGLKDRPGRRVNPVQPWVYPISHAPNATTTQP